MNKINTDNKIVAINKLKCNNYSTKLNFRENSELFKEYSKIKGSLCAFGQIEPILVRELEDGKFFAYEIINGCHTWHAMKELDYKEVEIKNVGKIDRDTAISMTLYIDDAKISVDNIELAQLLKNIVTTDKSIEHWAKLLPYSVEFIKSKIDLINFDFSQYDEEEEVIVPFDF